MSGWSKVRVHELGLKSFEGTENGSTNKLLTHVIFHPVQKSLNRLIQIDYTLRIQSLTTFTLMYGVLQKKAFYLEYSIYFAYTWSNPRDKIQKMAWSS